MFSFSGNPDLSEHHWGKISLILLNLLTYVAFLGFNLLASNDNPNNKLFTGSVGSNGLTLEIDIPGWVFFIVWFTIFIWNFVWLIYAVANIWRRTEKGDLLYRRINFFPWSLFVVFILNNLTVIAWLFVWDARIVGWSFFLIALSAIFVDICVLIVARRAHYKYDELNRHKRKFDIIATRITLNGLGLYATWLTLATNLNFAIFLTYTCGATPTVPETIALVCILIIVVAYFLVENFIWPRFFLYLFTPWVIVILALSASLSNNWNTVSMRNKILTLVLLSLAVLFAITKIILLILYRTSWSHRLQRPKRVRTIKLEPTTQGESNGKTTSFYRNDQIESF